MQGGKACDIFLSLNEFSYGKGKFPYFIMSTNYDLLFSIRFYIVWSASLYEDSHKEQFCKWVVFVLLSPKCVAFLPIDEQNRNFGLEDKYV